jgi:signal peptidase I
LAAALLWAATATGSVTYVATHGTSMAPRFHQGDLAVVHRSPAYEVGDVVAYRSALLDTVVMHRIVARDGDRYIFKGDNNSWLDRDEPTEAQLIGTLFVHLPRAGAAIDWIRSHLRLVAALLALMGAGAGSATRQHRRTGPTTMPAITQSRLHGWRGVAIGLGLFSLACAAIGLAGYTRPALSSVDTHVTYTQNGDFTYSATAPANPVYETGKVATGDPVYLRIVPGIDVQFAYDLTAANIRDASGTIALDAEVADGTGWTRRVQLQGSTRFEGARATASGHLAAADLQTLVAEVRAATGASGGTSTIVLLPDVRIDATVAGAVVSDRFQPRLLFQLDPQQLRPPQSSNNNGTVAEDPLHPTSTSTTTLPRPAAARLELMGHGVAVTDARKIGLAAVPVALAAIAFALALRRRLRPEAARIELHHGHRVVPIGGAARNANVAMVDVTTMRDLARLAEQDERLILHQQTDRGDVYLFQTDRTIYRYTARPLTG